MINLELNIKPYSINAYYYGNRAVKKSQAREWELNMVELLKKEEYQSQIKELSEQFDSKKHSIKVDIVTYYPKDIFFTKKGIMSSRAFDISNIEKPIIDVIFLEKYATRTIKNIGIDDRYISDMSSKKRPADNYKIEIKIQLLSLESLQDK